MATVAERESRGTRRPEPGTAALPNAFTVDVEDYYQVSAFANSVSKEEWPSYESRVERNTRRLLDRLDEHAVKGTFFVLGWVAEREPALVREIFARGHEIACHGYSHDLVYNQSPEVFRGETLRAKGFLEDTLGQAVNGYRAASYSVTRRSLWALDVLVEAGFTYDSSIFPISHDRYGIASAPRLPFELELGGGGSIREFPLTTVRLAGVSLPIAGGGYFRLLPYGWTRMGFRRVNARDGAPGVFYMHPWEIDPGQPRLNGSLLSRLRHYTNIDVCEARLTRLLTDFEWAPMGELLGRMTLGRVRVAELA
jgi:polysaccharide deacetylase family protein (PEP-CTERM system associated)